MKRLFALVLILCTGTAHAEAPSLPWQKWDPALFEGRTHTSPDERAAFQAVVDAGFADVVRPFTPGPGVYTYWDYTQLRFPRREGLRIDFVLGSPALAALVTDASIDRQERKGKGASDHAPVVVELSDAGS